MRTCLFCGEPTRFCCDQDTEQAACESCIPKIRAAVGGMRYSTFSPCPEKPAERLEREYQARQKQKAENRIIWADAQIEKRDEEMKAQNMKQAQQEGHDFALLFKAMIVETRHFETVSDFAQYFSVNVLGYTSAELANPWTKGFISAWLEQPKPEPTPLANGMEMVNQLRQMLGMEPLPATIVGLPDGNENDLPF